MKCKYLFFLPCFIILNSCYEPERNCLDFRDGTYNFTSEINGESKTTTFMRKGDLEVDYFEGKADSSRVRWINDCEYIVRKLNPRNASEEKAIQIKILSTTEESYSFEYNIVGSSNKSRGTAFKTN